jgi:hypothetical protein
MTTQAILRNDLNPTTDSSTNVRCSICLTNDEGTPTYVCSEVTKIWFVKPPNSQPLCQYMLDKVQNNVCLHSDISGYAIFNKNGDPNFTDGFEEGWVSLPVTLANSYPSSLLSGVFTMDLQ